MGLMVDNDIYECPNAFDEKKNTIWADNIESVASCDPISRKINDDAPLQRIPLQIVRNAACKRKSQFNMQENIVNSKNNNNNSAFIFIQALSHSHTCKFKKKTKKKLTHKRR